MKITEGDYRKLERLLKNTLEDYPGTIDWQRSKGYTNERIRWNIFHATTDKLMRHIDKTDYQWVRSLYDYLNDNHIDTALKRILSLE